MYTVIGFLSPTSWAVDDCNVCYSSWTLVEIGMCRKVWWISTVCFIEREFFGCGAVNMRIGRRTYLKKLKAQLWNFSFGTHCERKPNDYLYAAGLEGGGGDHVRMGQMEIDTKFQLENLDERTLRRCRCKWDYNVKWFSKRKLSVGRPSGYSGWT